MRELILVGIPLGAALVAGLILHFVRTRWLPRIFYAATAALLVLVPVAWLLIASAPDRKNWTTRTGGTCPDYDTIQGDLLAAIMFGSFALGGFALASAVLSANRKVAGAGSVAIGLVAAGIPWAIAIPFVFTALCGLS